jgi:hypothetical protein
LQKLGTDWQSASELHKRWIEIFNLKKLNEWELKEQYQVTITNKFAALENLRVQSKHPQGMEQY